MELESCYFAYELDLIDGSGNTIQSQSHEGDYVEVVADQVKDVGSFEFDF